MSMINGVSTPGGRTPKSVVVLTCLMHATAFAYIMRCTRDRPDWTIGVFCKYASLMRAGHVPYRDFLIEYPPLAAPVFWVPRLVTHTIVAYRVAFALEIFLFDLLGTAVALWALARFALRTPSWGVVLAQPLWLIGAGHSLVFDLFDLALAVLMLLAIALFTDRRARLAWRVLGLATALKLYPLVVAPLFVLAAWRRRTPQQAAADAVPFYRVPRPSSPSFCRVPQCAPVMGRCARYPHYRRAGVPRDACPGARAGPGARRAPMLCRISRGS